LDINGFATAQNIDGALPYFEDVAASANDIVIKPTETRLIDARFLGLFLMLDKQPHGQNPVKFCGDPASDQVRLSPQRI
jgi:hypothetical protein